MDLLRVGFCVVMVLRYVEGHIGRCVFLLSAHSPSMFHSSTLIVWKAVNGMLLQSVCGWLSCFLRYNFLRQC